MVVVVVYAAVVVVGIVVTHVSQSYSRQNDAERAERIGERVISLNPSDPALYVLLFNVYAAAGN